VEVEQILLVQCLLAAFRAFSRVCFGILKKCKKEESVYLVIAKKTQINENPL
jgi:hypothetical protein